MRSSISPPDPMAIDAVPVPPAAAVGNAESLGEYLVAIERETRAAAASVVAFLERRGGDGIRSSDGVRSDNVVVRAAVKLKGIALRKNQEMGEIIALERLTILAAANYFHMKIFFLVFFYTDSYIHN